MKSIIISPDKSLIFICLDISSAASRLVFTAVLSIFFCLIDFPEFTSIETRASVGLITKYPPEASFTLVSKISFSLSSISSFTNNGILSLYFFTLFTYYGISNFIKFFAFLYPSLPSTIIFFVSSSHISLKVLLIISLS